MRTTLLIILTCSSIYVKGQMSWEFVNKLYVIDNIGNIDSVLFGNDSSATIGIDTNFNEQNIIGTSWDSIEMRSIHRVSDSIDCPVNYWGSGNIFNGDFDLKKDIRQSGTFLNSSIFFLFKINAINYPIEIYSDFSEMYSNSGYNMWTVILKHHQECRYDYPANCVPQLSTYFHNYGFY